MVTFTDDALNRWKLDAETIPSKLLTRNPKIIKGERYGWRTVGLHFAPADLSGFNVCPASSCGCRAACLNKSGHGAINLDADGINGVQAARIRKTREFKRARRRFVAKLAKAIAAELVKADREGLKLAVRLNLTSDVRWELIRCGEFANIFEAFPTVQFYDYTKIPTAKRRAGVQWPENYHLTFSLSEDNAEQAAAELAAGFNVAAPFTTSTRKASDGSYRDALPEVAMIAGTIAPVIDGDLTDLRFADPAGVIVGLRAKGLKANIAEGVREGFILPA